MTGVPVQGAGTDDELREALAEALFVHRFGRAPSLWPTQGQIALADADALLSDPGVLAAMRHREQQAAAKALEVFADKWGRWVMENAPQIRGGATYRARCEATAIRASLEPEVTP